MVDKNTRVFMVEVEFLNDVTQELEVVKYMSFATDTFRLEEAARADLGPSFSRVISIQTVVDITPLYPVDIPPK